MIWPALLSGALLGLASLPIPAGAIAFVGLAPLLCTLIRPISLPRAFLCGFLAGLVFHGLGFGWIFQARVGGGIALPLAYALAIPMLASGVGLFALVTAWCARLSPLLALATAPSWWIAIEFTRAQEWMIAVPWNHLGYALGDWSSLAQPASIFGLYGLSAWIVAFNAALVGMHRLPLWARAAWLGLLALPLGAAELGPANQADAVDGARLRVAAVQPAIDERDRHVPKQLLRNLGRLLDLTDARLARHSDLVVWPESAWERVLGPGGDAFLAAIAHGLDTPLVSGAWVRERAPGGRWKNAAVLATRDGTTAVVAEKVHPVPVYERAPDTWITRRLAGAGLWSGHFSRGTPRGPLLLPTARKPGAVGVLVCIDASYPELARSLRRAGAQLLVTLSNEAGTGSWSATLHARITRLRAIENRMPVVRVGNTGPTQWIDARGRVVAELAPGRPAAASHALLLAGPIPPFVRIGDRGVVAASLLSALAMVAMRLGDSRRGVER